MSPAATIDSAYDSKTGTWQYVVADPETLDAVVIDPVLDFESSSQTISTETADGLLSLINSKHYRIVRVLETHAHADHLTAASYLQNALARQQGFRPPVCIGKRIRTVQQAFGQRYNVPAHELVEAFDLLFEDGDVFYIGNLKVEVTHLPGHTPDHIGYMIADNVFCGDSVFNADLGTARCDFPGGDAKALYDSTRKLLSLPDHYRIWTGHDYPTSGRQTPVPFMSVGDQKKQNRYLRDAVTATDFEKMRSERDASLNEPKLLHPSLQINIRGGKMPRAASDGQRYMHLPLKFSSQM
ncbi:putative metallo-beta-lactamase domain protein [Hortaea werneckii]|nr:putative metallo-beta-lactamase domain protein [Hortaea werneckii]KAI6911546.1 putative metallo-beta-lactamase domain protein [Hortaea werneckii]KAI7153748.1 putative metallo-beta-lactamase domain protein [Hortaea werneckii]KAI7548852.1 putative metallo-beta-lactamase domain protein [Hortaea werneckii]KAI7648049.1 putative metallo-beta-lactamase domain protein [Hortaea werneckii]